MSHVTEGPDLEAMIAALADAGVDYVIAGSVAAAAWVGSSPRPFGDLDIVPDLAPDNLARLAVVLERGGAQPVHRPDWVRRPTLAEIEAWTPRPATVERLDHQMHTIWGLLDVVPVIAGRYDDLLKRSAGVSAWGHAVRLAHPADLLATLRPDRARKHAARRVDPETAAAGLARGRATPHRLEAVRADAPTAAVRIRPEAPGDREAIRAVEFAAFENDPHRAPGSPPVEHRIVDALRDAGALALSLVAEGDHGVVGHVAFSPVRIDARQVGWFGLGPVAVRPDRQGRGIGATLIRHGIEAMRDRGARGLVLVGEPAYYHRFGFRACPGLVVEGVPPEYFMCLPFGPPPPRGGLTYHEAFLVDTG